jgi:hypothetical protein
VLVVAPDLAVARWRLLGLHEGAIMSTLKTLAIAAALAAVVTPAKANDHDQLYNAGVISLYVARCPNEVPLPVNSTRIAEAKKLWSTVPAADREAFVRGFDRQMAKQPPQDPTLTKQQDDCKTMTVLAVVAAGKFEYSRLTPIDHFAKTIKEGSE